MPRQKECVAMLLAGGQGSRLYALTSKIAKPAVPFGGKYRIIDFPLSNCVNSGIDTVGVLTQYQPLVLNDYIGNGQPWDLDRTYGGVHILSPYQAKHGSEWYRGTANAIYQNLPFIQRYNPEYVLILSGDHIYKMNYDKMLAFHKKNGADVTVATIRVPMSEASRFGIVNTGKNGKIEQFEEKPANPKSDLASMGIYIFTAEKLYKYLEKDEQTPNSSNDFGKNILPDMLASGEKMYAYVFSGYWKDVGTIDSLYDANMDLLGEKPVFDIADYNWRIHSRNPVAPPHYIGPDGVVTRSIVALGCEVDGTVKNSVLSSNVKVEEGAVIEDSVVFSGCTIARGAHIVNAIIDENVVIGENAVVGSGENPRKITVLGRDVHIGMCEVIEAGKIIEGDK
ncbi:MAG: glucose-1-phosphate adenylyltransferase [Candidatus Borkfalkiaceae bacterium]|nr:glucose-1-phosphate adenylyltransferase [Christensenellaceae bacterium]